MPTRTCTPAAFTGGGRPGPDDVAWCSPCVFVADLPAQDQRDERLRGIDRLVEFLFAPHAYASGDGSLSGSSSMSSIAFVRHGARGSMSALEAHAGPSIPTSPSHGLGGDRRRSRHQQAGSGLSPPGISNSRRAYLYDVNPVGDRCDGHRGHASLQSLAQFDVSWEQTRRLLAPVPRRSARRSSCAPLIAYLTKASATIYARSPSLATSRSCRAGRALLHLRECRLEPEGHGPSCPAYSQGRSVRLCCSLDARCGDMCKPHARHARTIEKLADGLAGVLPSTSGGDGSGPHVGLEFAVRRSACPACSSPFCSR